MTVEWDTCCKYISIQWVHFSCCSACPHLNVDGTFMWSLQQDVEVPVKVKASSGAQSQTPSCARTSFPLCRTWLGMAKTMDTSAGDRKVSSEAEKWVHFPRWGGNSAPPNAHHLSVPLKVSPHLTANFIFILKIPTKSFSLLHSQLLHTPVGIFYTYLKEMIRSGHCPCEVTIPARIEWHFQWTWFSARWDCRQHLPQIIKHRLSITMFSFSCAV